MTSILIPINRVEEFKKVCEDFDLECTEENTTPTVEENAVIMSIKYHVSEQALFELGGLFRLQCIMTDQQKGFRVSVMDNI